MILNRYIGLNLARGWLLTGVVIAAVFGLIGLIQELDRVTLQYTTLSAARYSLYMLPNQLVELSPVIALLGSIIALANLDRHNELTIISCTGFSRSQLLRAMAIPTLILMGLLWCLMEYVTPQLQQSAEQEKAHLRYSKDGFIPDGGLWSTDGRRYIHIRQLTEDLVPGWINLFEFNEERQLTRALKARNAQIGDDRNWLFRKVWEKKLVDGELRSAYYKELEVANLWERDELPTLSFLRDSMNLSVLYEYTQYLARNAQPTERHLHLFWQRALMPFTVLAMVLLATPISASVTAGRDRSFGLSIGIGAVVGIIFYLAAQIIYALGQIMDWNGAFVAALPALIIFACAMMLLSRMRW